jgi:hypothetical protein
MFRNAWWRGIETAIALHFRNKTQGTQSREQGSLREQLMANTDEAIKLRFAPDGNDDDWRGAKMFPRAGYEDDIDYRVGFVNGVMQDDASECVGERFIGNDALDITRPLHLGFVDGAVFGEHLRGGCYIPGARDRSSDGDQPYEDLFHGFTSYLG